MQDDYQSIFQTQNYWFKYFSLRVKIMRFIDHDVDRFSPREDAKVYTKERWMCYVYETSNLHCMNVT